MQYSVCHERQFEVDPFPNTQSVKCREVVGHVVVASCSVKYGLETSLKIGRNSDDKPRMHQRHHKTTETVVGNISTQMANLP